MMYDMDSLGSALAELGVKKGDILYVSSDITQLMYQLRKGFGVKNKACQNEALSLLTDTLQNSVSEEGTLLFPAFSWDWCRGNGFDIRTTKGEVGALPNWILMNRSDFVRTRHPIYSFLVWGKFAEKLRDMDNQDAWGSMSPFCFLRDNRAKQLFFNIEAFQGMTFTHYIEQEANVPYRHPKYFFGSYTDENGNAEMRMYSMFVRDMELEVECSVRSKWLIDNGAAVQTEWKENVLTVADLAASYPLIKNDILTNGGKNTLCFTSGAPDWSMPRSVPFEIKLPDS